MVFLFYNKWLLRALMLLAGLGVALTAWYYIGLSVEKMPEQGLRDSAAIISFFVAGWLVMLIAEVVDNHYVRALGCLCLGLGGFVSYRWVFQVDGPKLAELPDGASGMQLVRLGFWGALVLAAAMFVILVIRLVLDRLHFGRRPAPVARMDVNLGARPAGMGAPPVPDALPPIPIDTSPLNVSAQPAVPPAAPAGPAAVEPPAAPPRNAAPVSALTAIGGLYLGSRFELTPGEHSVGRQDAEVLLANDMQVSRKHATISVAPDGMATLSDAGSTNGTFVNDARVTSMQLAPGDVIRIGTTLFKVEA